VNLRVKPHLPLFHTLVEERAGVRRLPSLRGHGEGAAGHLWWRRLPPTLSLWKRISQTSSRIESVNLRVKPHLPLLHTLVEERAGVRRSHLSGAWKGIKGEGVTLAKTITIFLEALQPAIISY
jgi:hypothetical protein